MREKKISAGSYDLNKFLFGGYEKDIITTIYGPAGSGKTNLCILVTASQAKKGNKVIYIDTEGGFSIDRFKQICGDKYEEALKNVLILKPTTFSEQELAFEKLLKEIKNKKINLIVVDGITMLYRLELAEARKKNEEEIRKINSKLARQLRVLSEIARKKNIAVIVTNQVYSDFLSEEEKKEKSYYMVGGDILKYWSKCIIELRYNGKREMVLKKHRSLPEKKMSFEITNNGIRKKGWFLK